MLTIKHSRSLSDCLNDGSGSSDLQLYVCRIRVCTKCKTRFPETGAYFRTDRGKFYPLCKQCRKLSNMRWVRNSRRRMIKDLGGRCVCCHESDYEKLEFDHIDPDTRTWDTMAKSSMYRITLYRREIEAGLIQLLCKTCNTSKNKKDSECKCKSSGSRHE